MKDEIFGSYIFWVFIFTSFKASFFFKLRVFFNYVMSIFKVVWIVSTKTV